MRLCSLKYKKRGAERLILIKHVYIKKKDELKHKCNRLFCADMEREVYCEEISMKKLIKNPVKI